MADQGNAPMPPPPPTEEALNDSMDSIQKLARLQVVAEGGSEEEGLGEEDDEDEIGDGEEDEDESGDEEEEEEELSPQMLKKIVALKQLQMQRDKVHDAYLEARVELESRFRSQYEENYSKRAQILSGQLKVEVDLEKEGGEQLMAEANADLEEDTTPGIPHFWLQCLLRHEAMADIIEEKDVEALQYLEDVRCVEKETMLGFTLEFQFAENPFFTNAVLTKEYQTANIMDHGEPLLVSVEGTEIEWKPRHNLCKKSVKQKHRRKGGRSAEQVRTVTVTKDADSFFKFFKAPVMYEMPDEDDEEGIQNLPYEFNYEVSEIDYEIALIIRNNLVPKAILWYTGEAVDDEDEEGEEEDGGEEGEQECRQS
ncbi:unnamed protein product [Chrysoparadoxa australica]